MKNADDGGVGSCVCVSALFNADNGAVGRSNDEPCSRGHGSLGIAEEPESEEEEDGCRDANRYGGRKRKEQGEKGYACGDGCQFYKGAFAVGSEHGCPEE